MTKKRKEEYIMSQIVLGKVAFVDKGVYATASTYNTFDFVVDRKSVV